MDYAANRHLDDLPAGLAIRSFVAGDQGAVSALFETGLLAGQVAPNDTGADVENIAAAYFDDDRHHFWVGTLHGVVVGMIGVNADDHDTAEVRRLRVHADHQTGPLPAALLQTALNHCRQHGYLKVRLDTRFERCEALETFERLGFQHTRDRSAPGKDVLEFYADLYQSLDNGPKGKVKAGS